MGLADPGSHRPHPDLGDQLHAHPRLRVGVLQVVDELGQVLDRVDVVVRRRRDELDTRRGMPHLGDPRVDLVAGELPALARFRPLRHLDLKLLGVDQILAGDAEAAGRHLFHGAPPPVSVRITDKARGVLAAFARIAPTAQPVHRDGQRLVRLLADRAVGHGPGGETLDDALDRLDLLDGDRRRGRRDLQETAQRVEPAALIVHQLAVLLEDPVLAGSAGVLQLEDRVGVEEVILPVLPPLVLPAPFQVGLADQPIREGPPVAPEDLLGDDLQTDAAHPRGRPREILVDELLVQAHRLENLCAAVALDGRDPHLGHDLEDALVEALDVVLHRLCRGSGPSGSPPCASMSSSVSKAR